MDDAHDLSYALQLHDRSGLAELVERFYRPLIRRLSARPRFRKIDPQMIEEGVSTAIVEYIRKPTAFDRSAGRSLHDHFALAAERDVLNLLRSQTRRRRHEAEAAARAERENNDSVELDSPAGKAIENENAERLEQDRRRALALLTDPIDRRVFELQLEGEHRTEVFADVLGIAHLPKDEQVRRVKQAKDRIDKLLRRALRRPPENPAA